MTERPEEDFEIPEEIRRQFDFLMKAGATGDIAVMSLEGAEDGDVHYVLVHIYYAEEGVEIYPIGEIYTPHQALARFKPAEGLPHHTMVSFNPAEGLQDQMIVDIQVADEEEE